MAQPRFQPFQQPLLDLREELKRYRDKHHLSQSEMARRAATTQVSISRYENGEKISEQLENKIRNILIQELKQSEGPAFNIEFEDADGWQFGIFKFPPENSGDLVHIFDQDRSPQISVLACDATGSDIVAAKTAQLMEVAFGSAVGALGGIQITPAAIFRAVDSSVRFNKSYFREAPSLAVCVFERSNEYFSILNAGMPAALLFRGKEGTVTSIASSKVSPPGMQRSVQPPQQEAYRLCEDDVLLIFSDGFKSELEGATSYKLESQLRSVARALRSDIRSIGMKLLRTLEMNTDPRAVRDNMSFLIVRGK